MMTGPLTFGGEQVRLEVQVHDDELGRRCTVGAAPYLSSEMLDVLFELPENEPVPEASISPRWCQILAGIPDWALTRSGDEILRRFKPAATVQTVLAADPDRAWADQIATLRWFAPLARTMVLVADTSDAFAAAGPAAAAGVGVGIINADGTWFEAVRPRVASVQLTPHRWLLGECAIAELRESAEVPQSMPERTDRG